MVLVLLGGLTIGLSVGAKLLGSWGPNVATSAFTVALTITLIDRLVRREETERLAPRTTRALYTIGLGFRGLLGYIVFDYVLTHTDWDVIPTDGVAMIDLWLAGHDTEDVRREVITGEGVPVLLSEAEAFTRRLEDVRNRDRDILEPRLVAAMDDCVQDLGRAVFSYRLVGAVPGLRNADERRARSMASAVDAARVFALVLRQHAAEWLVIPEATRSLGAQPPDN